MESLSAVVRILRHRSRSDLADLLSRARVDFDKSSSFGRYSFFLTTVEVHAPIAEYDQLRSLPQADKDTIFNAILEVWPTGTDEMDIRSLDYRVDPDQPDLPLDGTSELQGELEALRNMMVDVATGGRRIDSVNGDYKEKYRVVADRLRELGLANPIPHRDLWDWYGKWSSGDLPNYKSRRDYLQQLFEPILTQLSEGPARRRGQVFPELTGWGRVDQGINQVRSQLRSASTEEGFQAVGLACRETLISLAQAVFDPSRHKDNKEIDVSKTDAKRMLEGYLSVEIRGKSHASARKHAKEAVDLANEVQHLRNATFREAALCAEATVSVVNIIAVVAGARD